MRGDVHVGCGERVRGNGLAARPAPRPGPTQPAGGAVAPAADYLKDVQACGRPESTLRSA
jgi:hypothetical protein